MTHRGTLTLGQYPPPVAKHGDTVIWCSPALYWELLEYDGNLFARECAGGGWVSVCKGGIVSCQEALQEYELGTDDCRA